MDMRIHPTPTDIHMDMPIHHTMAPTTTESSGTFKPDTELEGFCHHFFLSAICHHR